MGACLSRLSSALHPNRSFTHELALGPVSPGCLASELPSGARQHSQSPVSRIALPPHYRGDSRPLVSRLIEETTCLRQYAASPAPKSLIGALPFYDANMSQREPVARAAGLARRRCRYCAHAWWVSSALYRWASAARCLFLDELKGGPNFLIE